MLSLALRTGTLALLTFQFLACAQNTKQQQEDSNVAWKTKMQRLNHILIDLYPLTANKNEYNSYYNRDKIETSLQGLSDLSHSLEDESLKQRMSALDSDPLVPQISKSLAQDFRNALDGFQNGQVEYSRVIAKRTTNYCIQCHTRGNFGADFSSIQTDPRLSALKPLEQASLLAATRQFDSALKIYEELIGQPRTARKRIFEWESAAKRAMTLAIQVKYDAKRARRIVDKMISTPGVASFIKEDAHSWLRAIKSWEREPKSKKTVSKVKRAERLIETGQEQQVYHGDQSAMVHFLRASYLLHENLRLKNQKYHAKSLYLLGQTYDSIQPEGFELASDYYYRACIYHQPHSSQALKCFKRYEENVFLSFNASGGFSMPPTMHQHLQAMESLASPKRKK